MGIAVAGVRSQAGAGVARPGFDWLFVAVSTWFVVGGALDVWAHFHVPELETFFTPWHGALYSGAAALVVTMAFTAARRRMAGAAWSQTMPRGYGLSLFGLGLFFLGGFGDAVWHTLFGVEVDLEALVSPAHLLLNLANGLVVTGPLRAAWGRSEPRPAIGSIAPAFISAGLALYAIGFMTTYVHPLGRTWAAAEYGALAGNGALAVPLTVVRPVSMAMLFQVLGVTGVLLHGLIIAALVLLIVRRWGDGLPFGGFTLSFAVLGLLMAIPRDLHLSTGPWPIVGVAVGGGIAADVLVRLLRPSHDRVVAFRLFAAGVPLCLYGLYFLAVGLTGGLWWSPHLIGGSVVLGSIAGWLTSFVVLPPGMAAGATRATN